MMTTTAYIIVVSHHIIVKYYYMFQSDTKMTLKQHIDNNDILQKQWKIP